MSETQPRARYDTVIVGGGPAGLTAGMYSARQGLVTAIVAGSIGGQMLWASCVENFIGWAPISGAELVEKFREHVNRFGVDCFEPQLVNAIVPDGDEFDVYTREGLTLRTRTVVIASGKAPNRAAIDGETELTGRGVSYCATCDAPFFIGRPTAVIGAEESAADAALQLAALGAGPVTLVSARGIMAPAHVLDRLEADPSIEVLSAIPRRIEGADHVEALAVEHGGSEQRIEVAGVFIEMGSIKASDFAMGLVEVNERGEIVVDKSGATSTPGIYAAGDVTDEYGKQIVTAVGQGARAGMAVNRDLKRRALSGDTVRPD